MGKRRPSHCYVVEIAWPNRFRGADPDDVAALVSAWEGSSPDRTHRKRGGTHSIRLGKDGKRSLIPQFWFAVFTNKRAALRCATMAGYGEEAVYRRPLQPKESD